MTAAVKVLAPCWWFVWQQIAHALALALAAQASSGSVESFGPESVLDAPASEPLSCPPASGVSTGVAVSLEHAATAPIVERVRTEKVA